MHKVSFNSTKTFSYYPKQTSVMSNFDINTILKCFILCGIWTPMNNSMNKQSAFFWTVSVMILTMATRKAFQHSGSWASFWRMTSSRAKQPMAAISDGRIWWLDLLIFLWKMRNRCEHLPRQIHILYTNIYISYQCCCKWHSDGACQHIP